MTSCLLALALALVQGAAPETDFSRIRGANYIPSYASTSIKYWTDYRPDVIDRELGYARRLGLNSLRVYLHFVAWENNPERFLANFRDFVARCTRHGLRPLFVIFDSCFGTEPSMELIDSPIWVNNPGFSRIGRSHWRKLEKYVKDVVSPFEHQSTILGWDIMNEPMADFNHPTTPERNAIWEFVRHFCAFTKKADPGRPITVGHAVVEYIPKTLDLVDVASIHSYTASAEGFRKDIALARKFAADAGKPVVITECGNPGAGQHYEMVLQVVRQERIGFFFWELMIGKMMFKEMAGLVYPDGTVRDMAAVAALLGFERKTEGVPLKTPPDKTAMRRFLENPDQWKALVDRARKAPRTRKGVAPLVSGLVAVGRQQARPTPEAMKAFEYGLNIGHLFRLGREKEAIAEFEGLLALVEGLLE